MNAEPDWLEANLFSTIAKQDFFDNVRGKRCYHTPLSNEAAEALPSWEDFSRFLSYQRLSHPRIRMAQSGVPESRLAILTSRHSRRGEPIWDTHAERILTNLRNGATLVMDAVDLSIPRVRAMSMSVATHFLVRPQVNAYMTFSESRGFGLHWDDHDVLVVQLAGTKDWHMYGPTREAPLQTDFHEEHRAPSEVLDTVTLKPGDLFYVPRGHWHDVLGRGEPTLHLTIGISAATGIDLLSWLVERARSVPLFRQDIPLPSQSQRHEHSVAIREALTDLLSGEFQDDFWASLKQDATPYPFLSLPYGVVDTVLPPDTAQLRLAPSLYTTARRNGEFVINTDRRSSTLPLAGEELIHGLETDAMTVLETWERFGQDVSLDEWRRFIGELIHTGLLYIPTSTDVQ
jgi:hypothetical protein